MSTIKHPVGPQPEKVYWRRRLLLGLGLMAVIVVIFLIVVRPGSSSGEPSGTTAPTSSAAATTKASTAPNTIPTESTDAAGSACKPSTVQVRAITDHDHYAPGENPRLSLSVVNTGSKPCVFDAGTSKQTFTITSGDEKYWVSTDCQTDPVDAKITLEPGVAISSAAPITWDRTRSAADTCGATRDAVPAGGASYHLAIAVDGVKSDPVQFILD